MTKETSNESQPFANDPSIPPIDYGDEDNSVNVNVIKNDPIYNALRPPIESQIPIDSVAGDKWIKRWWRPMVGWSYIMITLFDFIAAPIATMVFFHLVGQPYVPWEPLTLKGGGLYHLSTGAVMGVAAWSRGQEKLKGIEK